jgi:hypothetical protein
MADETSLTLRVPVALRDALETAAQRQMRSVNSYVKALLATHLVAEKLLKPEDVGLVKAYGSRRAGRKAGA